MTVFKWRECDYCFLVTSDLGRHMQIAHNVRKSIKHPEKTSPQGFDHLSVGNCFYCKFHEPMTSDHVLPMRLGKQFNRSWNRVPACVRCNSKKADALPSAWFRQLLDDGGESYAHGPKSKSIIVSIPLIVDELMARPELAKYPTWIRP